MNASPLRFLGWPVPAAVRPGFETLQAHWQRLAPRERLGLQVALAALGLLLLVSVAVNPAFKTLRQAPNQQAQLRHQLQAMQEQAAEAAVLRSRPTVPAEQAQQALKAATEQLGSGSTVELQGGQARVVLREVEGEALRRYLADLRSTARARPVEAQLQRGPRGYNGSLLLQLGSQP
ncbi:type II secretion system protein GspM [Inhella gelatinilytica]|uniref:Type II secretion system protein M n=1 Tax=Inhella gelatinilytica TaxID=2795030 RepID=A0A931NAF0_9BURK|nr:type II secretion system protein GspM [Inhella gelatinilytica]MBH9552408.1 type II secretion system protein M [Inhella gelatinilytica]